MGATVKMYTWTVEWVDYEGASSRRTLSVVSNNIETATKRAKAAAKKVSSWRNPIILSCVRHSEVHL